MPKPVRRRAASIDMRMVYAVEGRRLRDPDHPLTSPIPATGRNVQWGPYWQAALDAGDITLDPPAPDVAAPEPPKPAKSAPPAASPAAPTVGAPPPPPAAEPVAAVKG